MKMRIPWIGLADQIEDNRHTTILLRRFLTKQELKDVTRTPRILVDACNRAVLDPECAANGAEKEELDLANYLIGEYEEAVVFLGSMVQE